MLCLGKQKREHYHGALITHFSGHPELANRGCISLGMFVFMSDTLEQSRAQRICVHEYGHCVQSLIFGPFFLLVVGLPSIIWAARYSARHRLNGIAYTSRYPENNANYWGHLITGELPIDW